MREERGVVQMQIEVWSEKNRRKSSGRNVAKEKCACMKSHKGIPSTQESSLNCSYYKCSLNKSKGNVTVNM